ncbi:MAG: hypothetical protein COA79_02080 [Planctomycetota bacterium]|nr:MAG: hypothetical protein COA79_02080 [Planctomycetota bacterium]
MKKCPSCNEDIHDDEIDCPFCDKPLNQPAKKSIKLQYKTTVIVMALITAGPLALPLVWFHPTYKKSTKIIFIVTTTIITILCLYVAKLMFHYMMQQIDMLYQYS